MQDESGFGGGNLPTSGEVTAIESQPKLSAEERLALTLNGDRSKGQSSLTQNEFDMIVANQLPVEAQLGVATVMRDFGAFERADVNKELGRGDRRVKLGNFQALFAECNKTYPNFNEMAKALVDGGLFDRQKLVYNEVTAYQSRTPDQVEKDLESYLLFSLGATHPAMSVALFKAASSKLGPEKFVGMVNKLGPVFEKFKASLPEEQRKSWLNQARDALTHNTTDGDVRPILSKLYSEAQPTKQVVQQNVPEVQKGDEYKYPDLRYLGGVVDAYRKAATGVPLPEGLPRLDSTQVQFLATSSELLISPGGNDERGGPLSEPEIEARGLICNVALEFAARGDSSLLQMLPISGDLSKSQLNIFYRTVIDLVADKYSAAKIAFGDRGTPLSFQMSDQYRDLQRDLLTFIPSQMRALGGG